MQPDAWTVEPGREQVVDRQVDARGVQLLEDRADPADRLAVGLVDPGQLDQRRLERLESRGRCCQAVSCDYFRGLH
jgi:hypothetical protein